MTCHRNATNGARACANTATLFCHCHRYTSFNPCVWTGSERHSLSRTQPIKPWEKVLVHFKSSVSSPAVQSAHAGFKIRSRGRRFDFHSTFLTSLVNLAVEGASDILNWGTVCTWSRGSHNCHSIWKAVEGAVAGCGAAGWLSLKPTLDEAFLVLLMSPRKSRSKTGFKYFKAFCRSLQHALEFRGCVDDWDGELAYFFVCTFGCFKVMQNAAI